MNLRKYLVDKPMFVNNGENCPYLKDRTWTFGGFYSADVNDSDYERLLDSGFRRMGRSFYVNNCEQCSACIPIRIDCSRFEEGRNHKRIIKKNADVEVTLDQNGLDNELLQVYADFNGLGNIPLKKLLDERFEALGLFFNFTQLVRYRINGKLVGIGWVDILPNGLSSVYFCYLSEYADRSLGTFSVLKEIEFCRHSNRKWLHLGFWVDGGARMNYKKRFRPAQILIHKQWRDFMDMSDRGVKKTYSTKSDN